VGVDADHNDERVEWGNTDIKEALRRAGYRSLPISAKSLARPRAPLLCSSDESPACLVLGDELHKAGLLLRGWQQGIEAPDEVCDHELEHR